MGSTIKQGGLFYKAHKFGGSTEYWKLLNGESVSLCGWFWFGILEMFKVLLGVSGVLIAIAFVGLLLTSILTFLFGHYFGYAGGKLSDLGAPMTTLLCLLSLGLGVMCCLHGDMKVSPEWLNKPLRKLFSKVKSTTPKPKKGPSTLSMYLKARKEKWCPMLTLEEEIDNEA